jgi:hypothetical protein
MLGCGVCADATIGSSSDAAATASRLVIMFGMVTS